MTKTDALARARETWPLATIRQARKIHRCDNAACQQRISAGAYYIDPGQSISHRAGLCRSKVIRSYLGKVEMSY